MIRSLLGGGMVLAALGGAPMQCKHDPDPSLRHEDDAGDALWNLAMDFRTKGNEAAAKQTLRYLVDHYPSNRHVPAARAELGEGSAAPPAPSK